MKTNIVDNFLRKASHDLGTAELIYKNKPEFTDTTTFHCKQTIEKCAELNPEFSTFSKEIFAEVNEIGMSVRYDDIENDPKAEEAFRFIEFAREIYKFVNHTLNRKV